MRPVLKGANTMHAMTAEAQPPAAWQPLPPRGDERPDVLFYGEEQLVPLLEGRRAPRTPGLVKSLLDAGTPGQRRGVVQQSLQAVGFDWLGYGTVTVQRGVPVPSSFFTSYAHPQWTQCYFRERFYEVDLRHHEAAPSNLPLVWDIAEVNSRASEPHRTRRHRQFAEELRACGLLSGVFLSLASWVRPEARTVISFASPAPSREWIDDGVLGRALVFALGLHEFLSLHMAAPGSERSTVLAPVQQQILHGLLQGLSDKEIADRLGLSIHAVDYHMRQLRRHFGVRNRVQLVHAAMRRGAD
jgi:DNA-binding CsgD family transcriptional regulator